MPNGYTPIYKILKDGADITARFNDRATEIQNDLKGGNGDSDQCRITIDDRDWRLGSISKGAKLDVYLGYKEVGLAQMGLFEVDTVDYEINPRQMKIIGNSVGFSTDLKAPAIKSFDDKTLGDIVTDIAKSGNVSAYIDPELAAVKLPFVNTSSSPMHHLGELERRFGVVAKFENGRLTFVKRDAGESASGLPTPLLILEPEHLSRGFVRHSQRGEYAAVKVGWFDPTTHAKEYATDGNSGDGGQTFMSGRLGRNREEAEAMAKSQMSALRRSMGEAHLTLSKGNPWIRDQMKVLLKGFREGIDGSYITDTVSHTYIKDAGITTLILAKPPGPGNSFSGDDDGAYSIGDVVSPVTTAPEFIDV